LHKKKGILGSQESNEKVVRPLNEISQGKQKKGVKGGGEGGVDGGEGKHEERLYNLSKQQKKLKITSVRQGEPILNIGKGKEENV